MHCQFCNSSETQVVDSRLAEDGNTVRRRRQCKQCERRFTTYERYEQRALTVRKSDGVRQPFDREKLLRGLVRATNKRPVDERQLEALVQEIEDELRSKGGELATSDIGGLALRGLRQLDQVAYVRFASVYRDFNDVTDFAEELERLENGADPEARTRKKRSPGA